MIAAQLGHFIDVADGAGLNRLSSLLEAARLEAETIAAGGPGERAPATNAPAATSLMITRQQRLRLRELGWSDGQIREMTPAQAHGHLGL